MANVKYILTICLLLVAFGLKAQDAPDASPTMSLITSTGETTEETPYSGSAPIKATFKANPTNVGSYTPYYEWRVYESGKETTPTLLRYVEDFDYTFSKSGTFMIKLYITYVNGTDSIAYEQADPFSITVSESKLDMPNAFTPNGDGINDIYKAKDGYTSIVSFHAVIFNRWGKKIYEWKDPAGGWDGKDGGSNVPVGAYYCIVTAKGADGHNYNIKKTINLLRDYNSSEGGSTTGN